MGLAFPQLTLSLPVKRSRTCGTRRYSCAANGVARRCGDVHHTVDRYTKDGGLSGTPIEDQVYFLVQRPPTSEFIAVVSFDHL